MAGALFLVCTHATATSWYMKPWKELYEHVHPGAKPPWRNLMEAQHWAVSERDKLEPYVLDVLRGRYPEKPWSSILFVIEAIPTAEIRDVLLQKTLELLDRNRTRRPDWSGEDTDIVTYIIDIFTKAGDVRIRPIVVEFITVEDQPHRAVEHSVLALRKLGNMESLPVLRGIQLRRTDVRMDRRCALAEKAIEMRERGEDIFSNAENELRGVNEAYIRAIENGDFGAFAAVHPYGFVGGVDEEEFRREILAHPDMGEIVRSLKEVAGREEFVVDREDYLATLIVEDRYKFTYVLEVDGWKISGPIRVGP